MGKNKDSEDTPPEVNEAIKGAKKIGTKIRMSQPFSKKVMQQKERVLKTILSEYLDSFIIVGFGPNGEEYQMAHADSPVDSRALNDLFDSYYEGEESEFTIVGFASEEDEDDDEEYRDSYDKD